MREGAKDAKFDCSAAIHRQQSALPPINRPAASARQQCGSGRYQLADLSTAAFIFFSRPSRLCGSIHLVHQQSDVGGHA